jgi:hypothetical protein
MTEAGIKIITNVLRIPYLFVAFVSCIVVIISVFILRTYLGFIYFLSASLMGASCLVIAVWITKEFIRKTIVFLHTLLGMSLLAWVIASIFSRNVVFENCKLGFNHCPALILFFAIVALTIIFFPLWFFTRSEIKDFYKKIN